MIVSSLVFKCQVSETQKPLLLMCFGMKLAKLKVFSSIARAMAKTVELLSRYTPFRLYCRTCPVNSICALGSSADGIGPAGSSRAAGYKPVANSAGADSTYTFACVFTSPSVPIPPIAIHALLLRDLNTTQITTKTNTPTAANPPIDTPTIAPVERPPFPGPFSSPPSPSIRSPPPTTSTLHHCPVFPCPSSPVLPPAARCTPSVSEYTSKHLSTPVKLLLSR